MDSITLFTRQVGEHTQLLCDLLASQSDAPVEAATLESALVSTRLLAGTSALMEFAEWEALLYGFHDLLDCYKRVGHHWDDRVAQVTSELIEREEVLVAAHDDDAGADLRAAVGPDELQALVSELSALCGEYESRPPPPHPVAPEPFQEVDDDAVDLLELGATRADALHPDGPLGGIITGLYSASHGVIDRLGRPAWQAREWENADTEEVRRDLGVLQFYARTIERIIFETVGSAVRPHTLLEPLRVVLADFCAELTRDSDRRLTVDLEGDEQPIDPHFLFAAGTVLQLMIADIYSRCDDSEIAVAVQVSTRNGALRWRVSDNGSNLISDSQLDHEDHLAFYPRLRDVTRTLNKHYGVLWVEPGRGSRSRFEFTLPATSDEESVHVWEMDGQKFAARSSQLCEVSPTDSGARGDDSYGEFLDYDNRRVPLVRLDVLFGRAPGAGDMVAVLGCLERRLAFYVPDAGTPQVGQRLGHSIPVWDGPPQLMVQVGDERIPVIDPESVLNYYHNVTGTMGSDDSSGGAMDEDSDSFQSQAASTRDVPAPPDSQGGAGAADTLIDVLVVEQNESMRDTLTGILNDNRVTATFAGGVEEAVHLIHDRAPRLIISEFRMPSMAAKRLVELLREEGRAIPLLVTTSQTGRTADLLVEKLGAAGYLSKPLRREEVTSRISNYLVPSPGG